MIKIIRKWIYSAVKYLWGIEALDVAPMIANNTSLAAALVYLRKRYKIFKPSSARFLTELYCYLSSDDNVIALPKTNPPLILHFCCWGEAYSEKVKNYLLPSLLSPGNITTVAETHQILIVIHCDGEAKNKLAASRVIEQIKKYVCVEFRVLPISLMRLYYINFRWAGVSFLKKINDIKANAKYILLGALQAQALSIAIKTKSYVSFLMPDVVVSPFFLTKLFALLKNKKVVVGGIFRTNYEAIADVLQTFFINEEKTILSIPPALLRDLQVNHMHAASQSVVISEETTQFIPCAQLLFKITNGFILRAFHYHPLLLDCCNVDYQFQLNYHPIDSMALNRMLSPDIPFDQQIAVVNQEPDVAFIEISDSSDHRATIRRLSSHSYDDFIHLIAKMISQRPDVYDTPLNHYLSAIRNRFESSQICHREPLISDEVFFQDLKKSLPSSQ